MSSTCKILIVDDEPDVAPLILQAFRRKVRAGDVVFAYAGDGQEALDTLEQDPAIELVLTDLNMPRMDGLTLLARLAEMERLIKAIVLTAYGDLDNLRTAMNQGAFDFLTKPIDLEDLEITVDKARVTLEQQKHAALVRETFGRYLSDEVAAALLEHPEALKLGGEKRKVTLLMSDLRGFSTIAERLPPEKVVEILNIYLGRMADVITAYNGTINEFIGDAILVVFGAPIQRYDDALRAVACAVEMHGEMDDVNAVMEKRGLPRLEMGIGIHTGVVVVGNIGSTKRAKYGVVGSHVNLAARIESYAVGGQVLTTENTLTEAGPAVLIGREMKLSAKGFSAPLNIYEVEGVGPPYDLSLPLPVDQLVQLDAAWSFQYTVLDGKHMTGDVHRGAVIRLSPSGAVIRTKEPLDLLSNLKMMLSSPENDGEVVGDLYAKVVDVSAAGDPCKIRFTAVPEEVARAIQHVCSA